MEGVVLSRRVYGIEQPGKAHEDRISRFLLEVRSNGTDLHISPGAALAKKCVCICLRISKGSVAKSI
jgi:hypothetical protein